MKGHALESLVAVGLSCGLRRGEMLGLQWADVDLDTGLLQVRRALQRFGGDSAARRPLLAQQQQIRKALADPTIADDQRNALRQELALIPQIT